jgi:hypothetical protein
VVIEANSGLSGFRGSVWDEAWQAGDVGIVGDELNTETFPEDGAKLLRTPRKASR